MLAGCSAGGAAESRAQGGITADPVVTEPMITGRLELVAGYALSDPGRRLGGLSGLLIAGDRLTAQTDRGGLWAAWLVWDGAGRLRPPTDWNTATFTSDGQDGPRDPDSEDITRLDSGDLLVALEGKHRILRYVASDPGAKPRPAPVPDGVDDAPGNGGIEALTVLPSGGLLILLEDLERPDGSHAAWFQAGPDTPWQALGYRSADGFLPTSADIHDGYVYVLERRFALPFGFSARVTRFPASALEADAIIVPEELGRLQAPFPIDNMEGLAVAAAPRGGIDLYLVSDDNFMPLFQRTLLLQFHLQDAAPAAVLAAGDRGQGR